MLNLYITNLKKLQDKDTVDNILMNISSFRKEKYDSFNNDTIKLEILAASYLIDEYLKTIGLREKNMLYKLTDRGKPYFQNEYSIKFSISHSKDIVGVAFSDREVGFDVQVVKDISDKVYNRVLSDNEKNDVFSAIGANEKLMRFFKYWVMKEAILKRDGIGLKSDMKNVCDDYGIVGILDDKNVLFENDVYYYCINNGFDKKFTINIK